MAAVDVVSPRPGVVADDAVLERQWADVFNSNLRAMDLQFVCYNLLTIGVAVHKLGASSTFTTAALVTLLPVNLDAVMLYTQVRRYPLFLRRRERFVLAARLLRLGEPPPAALPAAHVQGRRRCRRRRRRRRLCR